MRIPNAAQARAALTALYDDAMTNTRSQTIGNVIGNVTVATGVKCHLSVNKSQLMQGENFATVALDYSVYLPIAADVKTGDGLTVTHKGQTYNGKAGLPVRGSLSLVVPMTEVEIS